LKGRKKGGGFWWELEKLEGFKRLREALEMGASLFLSVWISGKIVTIP